ncbi:hypothetical protein MMH89_00640 [Candidatus Comchoanobacter bicostacola]|uniref:Uncharacterized protein n=1 Tax=Candidatus Comchoanobacter bicostacola TaxID=2919598 RepID=A0ABY5DLP2_9GAMM|nr:hypothetical protein [Candidatus Comchoanobacter bicostacola]UTC24672.1 hypothetical protein MMH89_00640 [Candidatus Comchoanobacter bicostacola]
MQEKDEIKLVDAIIAKLDQNKDRLTEVAKSDDQKRRIESLFEADDEYAIDMLKEDNLGVLPAPMESYDDNSLYADPIPYTYRELYKPTLESLKAEAESQKYIKGSTVMNLDWSQFDIDQILNMCFDELVSEFDQQKLKAYLITNVLNSCDLSMMYSLKQPQSAGQKLINKIRILYYQLRTKISGNKHSIGGKVLLGKVLSQRDAMVAMNRLKSFSIKGEEDSLANNFISESYKPAAERKQRNPN